MQNPLFVGVVLLLLYILALLANTANIYFIIMDKRLHQPMFLFVCNLAVADIVYCTSSCPTMVGILVVGCKSISYELCIVQMFVFHVGSLMEMLAISAMALDRFVAIVSPLRYHSILTNARCILLAIVLWFAAFVTMSMLPASVVPLQMCYSAIKYMFCDYASVIRATCVDPEPFFNRISLLTFIFVLGTFCFIFLSYVKILIVVVRISSKVEKTKAFKTCFSHFMVIICYYVPTFIRIVLTRIGVVLTLEERNGLMVGSVLGPSLINPVIYSFRTKEIRSSFKKIFQMLNLVYKSEQ